MKRRFLSILSAILIILLLAGSLGCGRQDGGPAGDGGTSENFDTGDGADSGDSETESETETEERAAFYGTPLEIIDYWVSVDYQVIGSGNNCTEVIIRTSTKDDVLGGFLKAGYELVEIDTVEGSKMETYVLADEAGINLITICWQPIQRKMCVMIDNAHSTSMEATRPNGTTGKGEITLAQIGAENGNNGMCYLAKLSNGKALIVDGGFGTASCADNLFNSMKKLGIGQSSDGKYMIEAWIFTHAHDDHIGTFLNFSGKYGAQTEIDYIMSNFPGESSTVTLSNYGDLKFENAVSTAYPDTKRINPHPNIKYYFGNATVSMLYTPELAYDESIYMSYFNDTSLIFRIESEGGSVLITGDASNKAAYTTWMLYEAGAFDSDIFQMAHHGFYETGTQTTAWNYLENIYKAASAQYAFVPYQSNDENNESYYYMVKYTKMKYSLSMVTNANDTHGMDIGDISKEYYLDFVESVQNGTNSHPTLLGYDGINRLTNAEGLVTFLGSNEKAVMITVFTLGGEGASLITNRELDGWLAS